MSNETANQVAAAPRTALSDRIALLGAACSTDEFRRNLAAPFSAEFWGKKWAVATDGHAMAAFESLAELRTDGPNIAKAVGAELPPKGKTTLAALREWAGEPVDEACEVCDGEGEYDACDCECPDCSGSHDCHDCDGTGRCFSIRYGRIAGGVLNRNLLSKVLRSAHAEGEVLLSQAGDMKPFIFRSGDWMAAVMPIRPTANDAKDCKDEFAALDAAPAAPKEPQP